MLSPRAASWKAYWRPIPSVQPVITGGKNTHATKQTHIDMSNMNMVGLSGSQSVDDDDGLSVTNAGQPFRLGGCLIVRSWVTEVVPEIEKSSTALQLY